MTREADEKLRVEFNEWAEQGRGEEMGRHHASIVAQTFDRMDLRPGDRVLDLGCGAGWATRLIASRVAGGERPGQAVGLDISDEMIRVARRNSTAFDNVMFVAGSAEQIPWEENFFTKILSVESFYYYPDQERALHEIFRVLAPHGEVFVLINLYKDNPYSLRWVDELKVPVQVRSEQEYVQLMREHAFEDVAAERIPDLTPTPDVYSGKWFKDAAELRDFKRIGALLLRGKKPDLISPPPAYQIY